MKESNKIYIEIDNKAHVYFGLQPDNAVEYIRKDIVTDAIKLAYGKVSMNPFDCQEAFEELLDKLNEM